MMQKLHSHYESEIFYRQMPTCQQTTQIQISDKLGALFLQEQVQQFHVFLFSLKFESFEIINSPHKENAYHTIILVHQQSPERQRKLEKSDHYVISVFQVLQHRI
ncbi:hypothetical protein V8G54_029924 [Vigna mungo]|uniref:Uncharacterized protein n=1 Tax=Vigna mungo TaxID=3915 RepID=A0AAQ3RJL9_VIGMU